MEFQILAWREMNFRGGSVKGFPGVGDGISRPWKNYFQGQLTGWAAPEKGFPGAVGAIARPWKFIFKDGPCTRPCKT